MSISPPTLGTDGTGYGQTGEAAAWAPRRGRRRKATAVAALLLALAAGGAVVAVAHPFGAGTSGTSGVVDNAYPTSLAAVQRRALQSQTEVGGTLGYAVTGNAVATDIYLPAGNAPSALAQATEQVAAGRQVLAADLAALGAVQAGNQQGLTQAQQAEGTSRAALGGADGANTQALAQAEAQVATAEQALRQTGIADTQALAQAEAQVATAEQALRQTGIADTQALAQAEAQVATAEQALRQTGIADAQALAQAEAQVGVAKAALASDGTQSSTDQAALAAEQQKEAADCQGPGAAGAGSSGTPGGGTGNGQGASGTCAADVAAVAQDHAVVTADLQKLAQDRTAVQAAQQQVAATTVKNSQTAQQAQAQLQAAQQQVAATTVKNSQTAQQAQAQLQAAQQQVAATTVKNSQTAQQAQAQLQAAQQQVAATTVKNSQTAQQAQAQLEAAQQQVAATAVKNSQTAQQAQAQVAAARLALADDQANLASLQAQAGGSAGAGAGGSGGGGAQTATYTELPSVGQVVKRGGQLFGVQDQPVVLLYGLVAPWRAFFSGMTPGPDVAELNSNLAALGDGGGRSGDTFTTATQAAVLRFQAAEGMAVTGQLGLGTVLFQPGAVQVTSVNPTLGSAVQTGQAVLQVTTTVRQVQVALDAAQQSEVRVGDAVSIVMPDNSTVPGHVSYVGTVATTPTAGGGNGPSNPTITVDVTPDNPAATGSLDDVPVNVWITTATVPDAYVVPVDALVALAGGGYALELVGAAGKHVLLAVSLGQFDDADGLVQVTGAGLASGLKIVVPGT